MPDYDVTTEGLNALILKLKRLSDTVGDPGVPLGLAAALQSAATEAVFAQGGDLDGAWPDILPASRAKRKGDKSAPPLTDTGALRLAATATSVGVAYSLFNIDPLAGALTMGVQRADAQRHQEGWKTEPARPFLDVTPDTEASIVSSWDDYFAAQAALV